MAAHSFTRTFVMFQKTVIALTILMVSTLATAIECGRSVRLADVKDLMDALIKAEDGLQSHSASLRTEPGNSVANEHYERVLYVRTISGDLTNDLSRIMLLIAIRDEMVDKRDRRTVEKLLSRSARHTAQTGLASRDRLDFVLTKITRASLASDISRIRDQAVRTHIAFEKCTAPKDAAK